MSKRIFALLLCLPLSVFAGVKWQLLHPGLEVASYSNDSTDGEVVAFRIDPKLYHFTIQVADQGAYVSTLGKEANAVVATNGGYFSKDLLPLGLRISNGQSISNIKSVSWWGIFSLENNQPKITTSREFHQTPKMNFAVQAGPRLVIDNQIPNLKPGVADRSAIAISKDNKIILAVSKSYSLTLTDWAHILKNKFGCKNALNLDGGSSSQLYSTEGYNISNYKPVTDAIIVR